MAAVRMYSPPARTVKRPNQRWDRQRPSTRGAGPTDDHGAGDIFVPSSGATAGIPGTWTPAGSTPPATVAALIAGNPVTVVANPATAWTVGQYVQTRTAGVPGQAHWSGTAWVAGAKPAAAVINVETHTVVEIEYWVDQNPDYADEVLAAEQARPSPRTTLVDWLTGFIESRDGVDP